MKRQFVFLSPSHLHTAPSPPFHSSISPLLFLFSAAPYKRQAQSQLQNDENEFSLQTKLKVSAVAGKIKKRRVEGDEKGVGENEEWSSNENDAEHGKWEWATGGIQTVSARKLHTKSNDVQSYFSQVLCSRHKLQAITLTPPHPPVQLTPAHTRPSPTFLPAP